MPNYYHAPIENLAIEKFQILGCADIHLPKCLEGHNFDEIDDKILNKLKEKVYGERQVSFPPVILGKLPSSAIIHKGRESIVSVENIFIDEQIPPSNVNYDTSIYTSNVNPNDCIKVEDDCILVNRWGFQTWGHWLGEIFPRVLLIEKQYPNKFKYVFPQDIFNISSPRAVWNSIWECMQFLNIGRERIIRVFYDNQYNFTNIHVMSKVFNEDTFHPLLLENMRSSFLIDQYIPLRPGRRIALMRTESHGRTISNIQNIIEILKNLDFEFVEIGRLPVVEQVTLFNSADQIVGVLASGLSGLFFSPINVKLIALAPLGYVNTFFIPILQQLNGKMYDLRGHITKEDARSSIFSDFLIEPDHLQKAITAMS